MLFEQLVERARVWVWVCVFSAEDHCVLPKHTAATPALTSVWTEEEREREREGDRERAKK